MVAAAPFDDAERRVRERGSALIEDARRRAHERWPGIRLRAEDYVTFVVERLSDSGDSDRELEGVMLEDLFLACACARGDAEAMRVFEAEVLSGVDLAVARIDRSAPFVDEVKERLRVRLLVGEPPDAPRITTYLGRGPLRSWVQVAAIRTALSLKRARSPDVADESALDENWVEADAELAQMRDQCRAAFRRAFERGVESLSDRERNVLRLYYVDGVTSEEIGRIYRAHRATVVRWLSGARQALLSQVRRDVARELRLRRSELESVMRFAGNQLDISIMSMLGRAR